MILNDYFNIMLTANQEAALNDTQTQDNEVSELQTVLDQAKREIFSKNRFQFNTYYQTFSKDANSEIRVPTTGILRFDVPVYLRSQVVERQRGEPLWDRILNAAYTQDIELLITADVDYQYIPEPFAQWIAWRAAELLCFKLNGADNTIVYIREQVQDARAAALNSEVWSTDGAFDFTRLGIAANQSARPYSRG